jgi:hypothetical protein
MLYFAKTDVFLITTKEQGKKPKYVLPFVFYQIHINNLSTETY